MFPPIQHDIDAKVQEISQLTGGGDPAVSRHAGRTTAMVRAVQGAEGAFIARIIPSVLAQAPHLTVVQQPVVALPERALALADQPRLPDMHMEYTGDGRQRRLDQLVLNHDVGSIEFTECKRGWKAIGADHRRTRLRDDRALRLIALSYAWHRFRMLPTHAATRIVSYYGRTGLPENLTIRAHELDDHYGVNVHAVIEEHLRYFRRALDQAVPGLTGCGP